MGKAVGNHSPVITFLCGLSCAAAATERDVPAGTQTATGGLPFTTAFRFSGVEKKVAGWRRGQLHPDVPAGT